MWQKEREREKKNQQKRICIPRDVIARGGENVFRLFLFFLEYIPPLRLMTLEPYLPRQHRVTFSLFFPGGSFTHSTLVGEDQRPFRRPQVKRKKEKKRTPLFFQLSQINMDDDDETTTEGGDKSYDFS